MYCAYLILRVLAWQRNGAPPVARLVLVTDGSYTLTLQVTDDDGDLDVIICDSGSSWFGGTGGKPALYVQAKTGLALFNLKNDIGEQHDVAGHHPGVVSRLTALAEKARDDLGDRATVRQGGGTRRPGRL